MPYTRALSQLSELFSIFKSAFRVETNDEASSLPLLAAAASPTPAPNQSGGLSQSQFTAVVIGTVVGGVAALAAAGLIIYFYCRRRNLERQFPEFPDSSLDGHRAMIPRGQLNPTSLPTMTIPPTPRDEWNHSMMPYTVTVPPNVAIATTNHEQVTEDSDSDTVSYINKDSYVTLSSGRIVMSPATRQSRHPTQNTRRPTTLVLDDTTSVSSFHYPMAPMPTTPAMKTIRRRELAQQMQAIRREMRFLEVEAAGNGQGDDGDHDGSDEQSERDNLRDLMKDMRAQLELLQSYMYSPWAKGETDMPPPGYTSFKATQ
ncbi:hypothetical protein MPER_04699 [Moniliophthora perniciosa FA553]|nr:hypothetical protein MPER_04699 [Moniliophthora perniciosa FA553]